MRRGRPLPWRRRGHPRRDIPCRDSFGLGRLLGGLGDLSAAADLLVHGLDDADRHGLPHVAHGEAAWGRESGRYRGGPWRLLAPWGGVWVRGGCETVLGVMVNVVVHVVVHEAPGPEV